MLFTKKLNFEICQRRIAVMQIEAAMNPSMGACLKHPCFKNLSLHHRYPPQGLVAANTLVGNDFAAAKTEFRSGSGPLKVFEAGMPKQAPMDGFIAPLSGPFPLRNWPDTNIWGITTP